MWRFEHTETTSATPAQLWSRYADPTSWPQWDHETESVTIEGPLAVGARGRLKPKGGPWTSFVVTEAEPGVGFADVTSLPLARLEFRHRIEAVPGGSRFTHAVTISGPLSPLFARVIGRTIAAEMPTAMAALARLATAATVS
jgi:Polyketide cyclase / dehydrase and lipid transport